MYKDAMRVLPRGLVRIVQGCDGGSSTSFDRFLTGFHKGFDGLQRCRGGV